MTTKKIQPCPMAALEDALMADLEKRGVIRGVEYVLDIRDLVAERVNGTGEGYPIKELEEYAILFIRVIRIALPLRRQAAEQAQLLQQFARYYSTVREQLGGTGRNLPLVKVPTRSIEHHIAHAQYAEFLMLMYEVSDPLPSLARFVTGALSLALELIDTWVAQKESCEVTHLFSIGGYCALADTRLAHIPIPASSPISPGTLHAACVGVGDAIKNIIRVDAGVSPQPRMRSVRTATGFQRIEVKFPKEETIL